MKKIISFFENAWEYMVLSYYCKLESDVEGVRTYKMKKSRVMPKVLIKIFRKNGLTVEQIMLLIKNPSEVIKNNDYPVYLYWQNSQFNVRAEEIGDRWSARAVFILK